MTRWNDENPESARRARIATLAAVTMSIAAAGSGCASVMTTHSAAPVRDKQGSLRVVGAGSDRRAMPMPGLRAGYRAPLGPKTDLGVGIGTHGLDVDLNYALYDPPQFTLSVNPSIGQGVWLWRDGYHLFTRSRLNVLADVVSTPGSSLTVSAGTGLLGIAVSPRPGETARGLYFEGLHSGLHFETYLSDRMSFVASADATFPVGREIDGMTIGARWWAPRKFKMVLTAGVRLSFGS